MANAMCKAYTSAFKSDNVCACRTFSWCLLYILIYWHVLIFTTVSPIPHNLWSWNFANPFFCPCQQQRNHKKNFNKCVYILWYARQSTILFMMWTYCCRGLYCYNTSVDPANKLMPSDQCNSTMAKAMCLIFSLFDVALAWEVAAVCTMHPSFVFYSSLLTAKKCRFNSCMWWLPFRNSIFSLYFILATVDPH